jgi:hypothetical protein
MTDAPIASLRTVGQGGRGYISRWKAVVGRMKGRSRGELVFSAQRIVLNRNKKLQHRNVFNQ